MDAAKFWIDQLSLQPHPEGGYYRVTYTAATEIAQRALPPGFTGPRPVATAIYFLLSNQGGIQTKSAPGDFSAFHRLRSDEMWHFYAGSPLAVHMIAPDARYTQMHIGPDISSGQKLQAVVAAGSWFASTPLLPDSYALVGCTVSPGFDFDDFELADRETLTHEFPQHADVVHRFTRT